MALRVPEGQPQLGTEKSDDQEFTDVLGGLSGSSTAKVAILLGSDGFCNRETLSSSHNLKAAWAGWAMATSPSWLPSGQGGSGQS